MMLELNVDEELYSFEIVKYSTANILFSKSSNSKGFNI